MKPRSWNSPLRLLVLIGLVGVLVPLAAIAGPVRDAHACSFAPESLEVFPSPEVMPGEWLKVRGSGFVDITFEPVEPEIDPDTGEEVPLNSCAGIVVKPKDPVIISIAGRPVADVSGPDFEAEVQVPADLPPGRTTLTAGSASVALAVAPSAPEPCPLAPDGVVSDRCNPCPLPANLVSPGYPCIEPPPCPVYLDAPLTSLAAVPPECPDPCDAASGTTAVWCPPEPCPVYLDAPLTQAVPSKCPDPCGLDDGTTAVWCPPEPCPVYLDAPLTSQAVVPPECPDPCGITNGTTAVWCPPEPCLYLDAPHEASLTQAVPPQKCPDPCGPFDTEVRACPVPLPEPIPVPAPIPVPEPEPIPVPAPIPAPASDPISVPELPMLDELVERFQQRSTNSVHKVLAVVSLGVFGG